MTTGFLSALGFKASRAPVDVVLVMMPFGPMRMPSLGLSMLAAVLRREEVSVRVEYPMVDYVRMMGEADFDVVSNGYGKLSLGEWIFSRMVDPVGTPEDFVALSAKSLRAKQVTELRRLVEKAVPLAAKLVEDTAQRIAKLAPRIVGLSSSFQQQMASVALARRLRELLPDVVLVLGGANCSAPMGEAMFEGYPEFDGVLVGPGEVSFPRLVRTLLAGEKVPPIPGLYWRPTATTPPADPGVAPEPVMDDLPYAYYDDFFDVWPLNDPRPPMIPFEGSRGCWWGQKQHCVFCSLNHSITYRAKKPERLYREIVHLTGLYPGHQLFATDDILDQRVIGTITDQLAALPVRPKLYYSVKSNLRKDQIRALAAAGVNAILPGVESLADEVLKAMRKGVTGLRNLQMLKFAQESGLRVSWAILYGFPFDKAEYYERMTAWLPSLTHLPAPRGLTDVRIQRYSPLFFQAEEFGVTNLRPRPVYALIHKVAPEILEKLAYNFDWDPPEDQSPYIEPLRGKVHAWLMAQKGTEADGPARLVYTGCGDGLVIGDTRPLPNCPPGPRLQRLDPIDAAICLAAENLQSRRQIAGALAAAGHDLTDETLAPRLTRLLEARLLIEHDDLFLFLACELPEERKGESPVLRQVREMAGIERAMALAGGVKRPLVSAVT